MIQRRARKKKRTPLNFVATCGAGLENLVREEVASFGGAEITSVPGAVSWTGNLQTGYRACLWSRFASRILLQLTQFEAADGDAVYTHAYSVPWEEHFENNATFASYCTLTDAELTHSHYAALRVKDAVVDRFRKRTGKRPNVDVNKPGIRLNLHVKGTQATLALELTGDSLHRRGYRMDGGTAPLKETLAAAIVHLSGWQQQATADSYLVDPMCGSGTLLIEAALMLSDSAPGLQRTTFGFMFWSKHSPKLWEKLVEEALAREDDWQPKNWPRIIGYDADPRAVASARKNIVAAGLNDVITVKQRQLAKLQCPGPKGFLLTNPPYGDRLSDRESVKYLYRCLGRTFRSEFDNWQIGFFTANPDLAEMTTIQWQERYRLYNGPIKCRLLVGPCTKPQEKPLHCWDIADLNDDGAEDDFANRLRKNCTTIFPLAERDGISCFRIYDADIPEFNLAIDLYEKWIHVQEYAPPSTVDADTAEKRFSHATQMIREVFGVGRSQVFVKTRSKQKETRQYQKQSGSGNLYQVREGGHRFLVNFTDYLDTGLFLDHRLTRARLGELVQGRTFLNLFGYTGTATVYAAKGGATSTTTVDMSSAYLLRASANLSLNGFGGPLHRTIEADCMQWIRQANEHFGVILVDPPTFSNAKHRNQVFDIQKDHQQLLDAAMQLLAEDGVLVFSSNLRKFKLAPQLLEEYEVREITDQTIPFDFKQKNHIHRCWEFRHIQESSTNV